VAAGAAKKTLAGSVEATLTQVELAALKKVRWHDRLVSLWAPVTVLAIVFAVYLVIVESLVCTSLWLQPLMQGVGLLAFAWWAALVVARLGARRWNGARAARYGAEEVLAEVERTANKHAGTIKDKPWGELVDATAALLKSFQVDEPAVTAAARQLEAVGERHLASLRGGGLLEFGTGFARALFIALAFRAVLVEPFKIPSGSMIPTLQIGDQIFVNKFIYGVRLPFTNYVPFVLVRPPKRGDVIVFNNPANLAVDYIKRVVGVPGDRFEFDEQGFTVNGQGFPSTVETQPFGYWDSNTPEAEGWGEMFQRWTTNDWRYHGGETLYREVIDGQPHLKLENREVSNATALPRMMERSFTVPEGHVFVMGDNRNNSEDGRFGLSDHTGHPRFVPYGNIKGKATVIWLALDHGGFGRGVFGGTGLLYSRFFKSVSMCGSEAPLPDPLNEGP
jgi:signal peptidase I